MGSFIDRQHSRLILWLPVGIGLGILFHSLFFSLPLVVWIFWFFLILGFSGGLGALGFRFVFTGIASIFVGLFAFHLRIQNCSTPLLDKPHHNLRINGIVQSIEHHPKHENQCRIIIKVEQAPIPLSSVRLTLPKNDWKPGDQVKGVVDLLPFSSPVTLNGVDWRKNAFFQGLSATGRFRFVEEHVPCQSSSLNQWRYELTQAIENRLKGQEGAIGAALVTGDRSGITPQLRQAFADSGIAHILAISGLHMSLVIGLVFIVVRRFLSLIPCVALHYPIKSWAATIAIGVSSFYMAISGFSFPVMRSFLMSCLVMLGILLNKLTLSFRSVTFAATVVLLLFPESLFNLSFQLSFAAVFALIAGYEVFYESFWEKFHQHKVLLFFIGLIFSTTLATIATAPFSLVAFQRLTLQSFLGNILAIPLTSFWIMPWAIICIISLIWGGWGIAYTAWHWGLKGLINIAYFVSSLPGSALEIAHPSSFFLPLCVGGGLWLCLWQGKERLLGFIFIFSSFLTFLFPLKQPDIYIAQDNSVIAYRQGTTLWVSNPKKGSFFWESWQKAYGLKEVKSWASLCMLYDPQTLLWANPRQILCPVPNGVLSIFSNGQLSDPTFINLQERGTCFSWKTEKGWSYKCTKAGLLDKPWK